MNDDVRLPDAVQSIPEALAFWAKWRPDAVALLSPGREATTYRELHAGVERLASALRALGCGQGDGIAVLMPEGPDLCLALLAATAVGIAIPLPWPSPEREFRGILAHRIIRAVLVSAEMPPPLARAGHGAPVIALPTGGAGRAGEGRIEGRPLGDPMPSRQPNPDDVALVLHSSGATGRPKRTPRTHRAVVSTCQTMIGARAKTSADRCLSLARTAHSQGFNALMYTLFSGASLITVPNLDLDAMPAWLQMFRPTYISTTPAVLSTLESDLGGLAAAVRRSPLRSIHSTAGPLLPDHLSRLEARFGVPVLNGYGMSEAPGIAADRYPRVHRAPGSVGPPLCDVRFVDDEGQPAGDDRAGEIVVRGPRVFAGYLDDPQATAAVFLPGGWFRTGDLGYLDDGGFLHLTGRLREIINCGGENIAPHEVDDVLGGHPAVAEAAVFGVPNARLGEDIVAAVVPTPDMPIAPRELRTWMLERLAPQKVPRRIWFVDELPRTASGKVRRGELARRWDEDHR